ncbi:MAG: helix-turn-helix transcriptional regulator [Bdellovibrionaceae bacterium]|nr:helix-turn-helix transcriptional regulator [Pseudobdellovibrionaceae bacterium]
MKEVVVGLALEEILNKSGIAICVTDMEKKILYQNMESATVCGARNEGRCPTGVFGTCKIPDEDVNAHLGVRQCPGDRVNNRLYDVFLVNTGNHLITLSIPLSEMMENEMTKYRQYNLTHREMEIVGLVLLKKSNQDIGRILHISENTVKTHLKNLYRKLPAQERKYLRELRPRE